MISVLFIKTLQIQWSPANFDLMGLDPSQIIENPVQPEILKKCLLNLLKII